MSSKTSKEITPFTVLLNAAHVGKLKRLKKFAAALDDGKGIARTVNSIKDENGRGALHFAASGGNLNICKYLIEELKLDVNVKDGTGETPLARAAIEGRFSVVEYLLEKGANPDISDDENVTPLHCAAMRGHKEIIPLLLSRGNNVDVVNDFGTPLQYAVTYGNHDAVKVLLDHHANPNLFFHHTFTPLQASMFSRSLQCTEILIKANNIDPHDAAVLSNRSMSYAHMKKGELALDDARNCILLRPDWPKAYYRAGVALNILKRYDDAADAFFEGLKLDPQSKELEVAFREAAEARLKSINVK